MPWLLKSAIIYLLIDVTDKAEKFNPLSNSTQYQHEIIRLSFSDLIFITAEKLSSKQNLEAVRAALTTGSNLYQ